MIQLLIIADDFTGALDTGVQFSKKGIETRVIVGDKQSNSGLDMDLYGDVQVLVVDAETRHMNCKDAYEKVFSIVTQAGELGIPYLYKKTDSALRGNIGSELSALLDASGETALPFVPAFPKMKRTTQKGIHYIGGVPVSRSVFGQDPFEPVKKNSVKEIIGLQSEIEVTEWQEPLNIQWNTEGIWVFDSSSDEEIRKIGNLLKENEKCRILAGCAGFASALPEMLGLQENAAEWEVMEQKLLVICGSVNPITRKQMQYGEACGYARKYLTVKEKVEKEYWSTDEGKKTILQLKEICNKKRCCIVDSNDTGDRTETEEYMKQNQISSEQIRSDISQTLGVVLKKFLEEGTRAVLLVTGGDTLLGFMDAIGCWELKPIREILPGCVLTKVAYSGEEYHLITKSGGFGNEDLLENIVKILKNQT